MKIAIALILLLASGYADTCTGFLEDEYKSGMNKICIYNHLGSDVAKTIKAYELCPLNIFVSH